MRLTAPARLREPLDLSFLGRAARARDGLEIDLGGVEWVSPAGVAGLLAACLGASSRPGLEATVHLPQSRETLTYLARIGFLAELERNGWVGDGEPDLDPAAAIGPHLPVTRLTTENEVVDASEALPAMLDEAGLAGDLSISLVDVLAEVAGNACEHGSACYVVAEVTGRGEAPGIYLAVADFGKGFAETLRGKHGRMTDSAAIRHAFTERVSGTGLRERGFGLGQVADVVDVNPKNVLWVFSRAGYAIRSRGQFESGREGHQFFPGTLVAVWVPAAPHAPQQVWR